ncbi:MAG: UDP-N-acetylmuramate--L-alanine ligase [Fimbriimonadaceae bacterium]|nr:UDP-N-acetylmuramate--L-alanine ligase [Fimbriimonadaceae bacterium]
MERQPGGSEAVHIVAVGGVMMSAIARLLVETGHRVSGSDLEESAYTTALRALGVAVTIGHAAANVPPDCAWVGISSAVRPDNPEVQEAQRRGLAVLKRDAVLGRLINPRRGWAAAGTHGKTTTSGLGAVLLTEAGLQPTFLVGSTVSNYGVNGRGGAGQWVVVEADEYDRAFLTLQPEVALVTNLEHDHPDVYRDLDDLRETFRQFLSQVRPAGRVILNADCPNTPRLRDAAAAPVETFGWAPQADWRILSQDPRGLANFALRDPLGVVHQVETRLLGRHNVANCAAALAAAAAAGVPIAQAVELAALFQGTGRRLEVLATAGGLRVVDDYAHHPTEVAATIAAARAWGGRLRVVYEPHQYARTRELLADYAGVFEAADETLICDIHVARETDLSGVSAADVARVAGGAAAGVRYVGPPAAAKEALLASAGREETWLVMGAGNITHLAHELAAWVREPVR